MILTQDMRRRKARRAASRPATGPIGLPYHRFLKLGFFGLVGGYRSDAISSFAVKHVPDHSAGSDSTNALVFTFSLRAASHRQMT